VPTLIRTSIKDPSLVARVSQFLQDLGLPTWITELGEGKRRLVSPKDLEAIRRLAGEGRTTREIAIEIGFKAPTVRAAMIRHKIPAGVRPGGRPKFPDKEIEAALAGVRSLKEATRRSGIPRSTLSRRRQGESTYIPRTAIDHPAVESIRNHIALGKTISETANILGMKRSTVARIMSTRGIKSLNKPGGRARPTVAVPLPKKLRTATKSKPRRTTKVIPMPPKVIDLADREALIAEAVAAGRVTRITPAETADYNTLVARSKGRGWKSKGIR